MPKNEPQYILCLLGHCSITPRVPVGSTVVVVAAGAGVSFLHETLDCFHCSWRSVRFHSECRLRLLAYKKEKEKLRKVYARTNKWAVNESELAKRSIETSSSPSGKWALSNSPSGKSTLSNRRHSPFGDGSDWQGKANGAHLFEQRSKEIPTAPQTSITVLDLGPPGRITRDGTTSKWDVGFGSP